MILTDASNYTIINSKATPEGAWQELNGDQEQIGGHSLIRATRGGNGEAERTEELLKTGEKPISAQERGHSSSHDAKTDNHSFKTGCGEATAGNCNHAVF